MGCWAAPHKTKQAEAVRKIMMEPLPVGLANDKLYHLIGDDDFADSIDEAKDEATFTCDTDVRHIVMSFLQTWFGENGDDAERLEEWGFCDSFEDGALAIFKDMLTDWNQNERFPADRASDGSTVMTPRQLANYLQTHIEDLATRQPSRASKIFRHIFPEYPIVSKKNGTFQIDFE